MTWECSECGEVTNAFRRPVACKECGTAGVIFVDVGPDEAEGMDGNGMREAWLEAGLRRAAGGGDVPAPLGFS
jgi:hypothetical protein